MTWRVPRNLPPQLGGKLEGLEYEILQEKAAALNRIGRGLERALQALRAFDQEQAGGAMLGADAARQRDRLVQAAGEALWYYVVQREVCGLRDTETVMRDLGVPREVRLRMGLRPRTET